MFSVYLDPVIALVFRKSQAEMGYHCLSLVPSSSAYSSGREGYDYKQGSRLRTPPGPEELIKAEEPNILFIFHLFTVPD